MLPATVRIAPSILSADFGNLANEVKQAEAGGADQIHVDVMDGHFVPNITIGPVVVSAIRRATRLPLDVHLMITEPEKYISQFAQAGADAITVHVEATAAVDNVLKSIKEHGKRAGITLRPGTPLAAIEKVIPDIDIVLIMSVEPGFAGQAFIEESVSRIAALRKQLDALGSVADIAVDGGISSTTAGRVVKAGANVLIAGSAIFRSDLSIADGIRDLREAAVAK